MKRILPTGPRISQEVPWRPGEPQRLQCPSPPNFPLLPLPCPPTTVHSPNNYPHIIFYSKQLRLYLKSICRFPLSTSISLNYHSPLARFISFSPRPLSKWTRPSRVTSQSWCDHASDTGLYTCLLISMLHFYHTDSEESHGLVKCIASRFDDVVSDSHVVHCNIMSATPCIHVSFSTLPILGFSQNNVTNDP